MSLLILLFNTVSGKHRTVMSKGLSYLLTCNGWRLIVSIKWIIRWIIWYLNYLSYFRSHSVTPPFRLRNCIAERCAVSSDVRSFRGFISTGVPSSYTPVYPWLASSTVTASAPQWKDSTDVRFIEPVPAAGRMTVSAGMSVVFFRPLTVSTVWTYV